MQTQTIRTSVDLQADLITRLRYLSADSGMSIKQILHQATADYLDKKSQIDRVSARKTLREITAMSRIGRQKVNLTAAAIAERQKLAYAGVSH